MLFFYLIYMDGIVLEGLDDMEELFNDMILSSSDKRKAIKTGIKIIAEGLEEDTPRGPSGELSEIKVTVREKDLATEGLARSKAFYDVFQNFGTSEQKAHVGYFERSVNSNSNKALSEMAEVIFNKMR
ncbi:HK97-gp10 family putative phage morphogenesis protein [Clostridium thermobutyricum]|uniref:HK97-gp10 family putative phage morphogenesis protein n=1 Tax=Clostridium thermobutyricum TaxID=29372 RepID=UPI003F52433B